MFPEHRGPVRIGLQEERLSEAVVFVLRIRVGGTPTTHMTRCAVQRTVALARASPETENARIGIVRSELLENHAGVNQAAGAPADRDAGRSGKATTHQGATSVATSDVRPNHRAEVTGEATTSQMSIDRAREQR
jgi:hypothetical protein